MDRKRTLSSCGGSSSEDNSSDNADSPMKMSKYEMNSSAPRPEYSSFAQRMMSQMGYKEGKGLGRHETGRIDIIEASKQRGRRGLGLRLDGLEAKTDAVWNEDNVMIRQDPEWIPKNVHPIPLAEVLSTWTSMAERKKSIDDEDQFCEQEILSGILKSKTIFDNLDSNELFKARTRANPYETIRGAIFLNRAAMKIAEVDASFDYMFTKHHAVKENNDLLYFADICAGPGGFSEYVLWRTKWRGKGFGFTLKAEWANDFKLDDFIAGTPETFDCHYGVGGYNGDGDIFSEGNLTAFRKYVMENTDNLGVHFVMADGGFSVEGQENIQEVLSKQLYLCQFTCALSIIRTGGHFICKLFDVFTPFSVGLIYLMYRAFEQVCIFKPVTSRPANSERYIVCQSLRSDSNAIHDYMYEINIKINKLKDSDIDIREVVPVSLMKEDSSFYEYIFNSNNTIGARQILGLRKLATYVQNTLLVGPDQTEVRKHCLAAWDVPKDARSNFTKTDPDVQFEKLMKYGSEEWMAKTETLINEANLQQVKSVHDYKCVLSGGDRVYLFSLGRQFIFKWDFREHSEPYWKRVDKINLELPRFTLLDAELVYELKGDGRGQRKVLAVHIIDVIYLGEEYVGEKSLSDRIKYAETYAKALSKPCRSDIVSVRVKNYFGMQDLSDVLEKLEIRHMKPRMEKRLSYIFDDEKYFVPIGMYLIRRLKEPWHLQFSRSSKRLYFYNSLTKESTFEGVKDSVANVDYCTDNRLYWSWNDLNLNLVPSKPTDLSKQALIEFIASK